MSTHRFHGLLAKQAPNHDVFVFVAEPKDVLAVASIDRMGRNDAGELRGFQRHQISSHIRDIRNYLSRPDALLPNAVIVAFLSGVKIVKRQGDYIEIVVDSRDGPPGYVVDGQQRLTALSGIQKPGFQVFVTALICRNYDELRQQFVFVNSARPLPKTLIYELLPNIDGLPERYSSRRFAARVVEKLNFSGSPAIRGQIRQHTNPSGVISDTAMQRLVMNSTSQGAIRELIAFDDRESRAVQLIDEFFKAVAMVFGGEWTGMAPRHSRLRHGAGIVSMGFVMDLLYATKKINTCDGFAKSLKLLRPFTSWTSGEWQIPGYKVPWNGIENTSSDIDILSRYLVSTIKRQLRKQQR